ncbi:MAG: hypothetical protein WBJ81_07365, partial [Rickettsiales bacterium]
MYNEDGPSQALRRLIRNFDEEQIKALKDLILSENIFKFAEEGYDINCFIDSLQIDNREGDSRGFSLRNSPAWIKYNSKQHNTFRNKIKKIIRNYSIIHGIINLTSEQQKDEYYNILKKHFDEMYPSIKVMDVFRMVERLTEDQWKNFENSFRNKYIKNYVDKHNDYAIILTDLQNIRRNGAINGQGNNYSIYRSKMDYLLTQSDFREMLEGQIKTSSSLNKNNNFSASNIPTGTSSQERISTVMSSPAPVARVSANSLDAALGAASNIPTGTSSQERISTVMSSPAVAKVSANSIDAALGTASNIPTGTSSQERISTVMSSPAVAKVSANSIDAALGAASNIPTGTSSQERISTVMSSPAVAKVSANSLDAALGAASNIPTGTSSQERISTVMSSPTPVAKVSANSLDAALSAASNEKNLNLSEGNLSREDTSSSASVASDLLNNIKFSALSESERKELLDVVDALISIRGNSSPENKPASKTDLELNSRDKKRVSSQISGGNSLVG